MKTNRDTIKMRKFKSMLDDLSSIIEDSSINKYSRTSLKLEDTQSVSNYLQLKIGSKLKEHFVVLFLDTRNNLISETVSIGTLNASLVHPREVFRSAISYNASHIVVAHNHPSGDVNPSEADISVMNRLKEAGKILGINLTDSIIVSENFYMSWKERGML